MEEIVHLSEVIRDRENRIDKINYLTRAFKGTIVCLKLNIPGPVKDRLSYREIFRYGVSDFKSRCPAVVFSEINYLRSGPVGYFVVEEDSFVVKNLCIAIEEETEAGRLFDFDVYHNGYPLKRTSVGKSERKCILCDNDVWICSRSRSHSVDELLREIEKIIGGTLKGGKS